MIATKIQKNNTDNGACMHAFAHLSSKVSVMCYPLTLKRSCGGVAALKSWWIVMKEGDGGGGGMGGAGVV